MTTTEAAPVEGSLVVAVKEVAASQLHIGLVYRDHIGGVFRLLDLAWHHQLRCVQFDGSYLLVQPKIHPLRLAQVAAMCRRVSKSNEIGIPYAFDVPNDCFDRQTGQYLLGDGRVGLTCATFVLAIFQAARVQLAEYATWPPRKDDVVWQQEIVRQLHMSGATPAHVQAVQSQLGAVRFRPEEVAGASICDKLPAHFEEALAAGRRILASLSSGGCSK